MADMTNSTLLRFGPTERQLEFLYDKDEINFKAVAEFLGLERSVLASICGLNTDSVRFDNKMPGSVGELLTKIAFLIELIAFHFKKDQAKTLMWFKSKNLEFGVVPLDLIKAGKLGDLTELLSNREKEKIPS